MSPELVTIWVSSRNRQQDRYLHRMRTGGEDHEVIIHLPCVTRQLSGHAHITLPGLETVYAANVVQASANYTH